MPLVEGLIYHAGGLGDFVLSLPAIERVRRAFPDRRWRFWGPRERLVLLPGVFGCPPDLLREGHTLWGGTPSPGVEGVLDRIDPVLAFGGQGAPPWIRHVRGQALGVASFPPAGGPRVPVYQRDQLDIAGVPRLPGRWLPEWRAAVLPRRRPERLVLHPGSGYPLKNLPVGTWAEAVARIQESELRRVTVVVGPAEIEREELSPFHRIGSVEVCESLEDLLAVLGTAALYLGNDSGPTHLASLLGIPTVAVFGPTDPRLWAPMGPLVRIVQSQARCAPCTSGGTVRCGHPLCLEAVYPETIAKAAQGLLSRTGRNLSDSQG